MAVTPLEYFLGRKTAAATDLLETNEDVSGFVAALLQHLVDYAKAEGISYRQIRLDRPYVTNDGEIRARIQKGHNPR